jgi:hypothetical protein
VDSNEKHILHQTDLYLIDPVILFRNPGTVSSSKRLGKPFSDGLAAVRVESKWGYIDKTGKFVIEPQFVGAGPFSEGLAAVSSSDFLSVARALDTEATVSSGFINKQGKTVFSLPFDTATPFVNGISRVRVDIKSGYIDRTGKYIWQPSN